MLTFERRALVTKLQDRLIELDVQQDEARGQKIGTESMSCKSRSITPRRSGTRSTVEAP